MNRLEASIDNAQALADGLAQQLRHWSLAHGADAPAADAAAAAGRAASLASGEGHVCLPLSECAQGDVAALRTSLLASGVVGTPQSPGRLPLLLDDADRLYLHRAHDDERRLAQRLRLAAAMPAVQPGREALELLRTLFAPGNGVDWQQAAVALALRRSLLLVSGGPGTGKTTTVAWLLACLLEQQPQLRVALAAPTGKAAARLADALRQRAAALPERLRARLPTRAGTVHRLLGASPRGYAHDARNRLPIDLLVVDEASMLDLALARRLLEAVPDTARIVLLGDKDQLAAVQAGAVFAETSADTTLTPACRAQLAADCGVDAAHVDPPPAATPGTLPDSTIWLVRNHRFAAGSGIGALADAVRRGDGDAALHLLREGGGGSLAWFDDGGAAPGEPAWAHIADGFAPYLQAVLRDPHDADRVAAAFERFRVLCALRDGARGAAAINRRVSELARTRLASLHAALGDAAGEWYLGRPVTVQRNDPLLRLFNGDIGFVLPAPGGGAPQVHFPDGGGGWRGFAPQRLPACDTAFASTVHKSQGSEFDAVLVLLPAQASRVLGRELLYTAVTRARQRVAVAAPAAQLAAAVAAPMQRHSGLGDRLRAPG